VDHGLDPGRGLTRVVAPRGPGTVFRQGRPRKWNEITNDPAWTIMLVEASAESAVTWTKPQDLPYDPEHPRRGVSQEWSAGLLGKGGFALFVDGHVGIIPSNVDPDLLRALFTADGVQRPRTDLTWF